MSSDAFQTHFYAECGEITAELGKLGLEDAVGSSENEVERKQRLSTQYEKISKRTEMLQKFYNEQSHFLLQYELRRAQEQMNNINRLSQEKREQLFPKKKFGFRSKQNITTLAAAIETNQTAQTTQAQKVEVVEPVREYENTFTFKDINKQEITKLSEEIAGKDVVLMNIKDSTIKLFGNPSVVQLKNIENSTILCGPVTGSAFIDNCKSCKIIVASHQLRIHDTEATQFYIHVGSRAIVENCKNVLFGPYAWSYAGIEQHFKNADFDFAKINWRSIDDFNWLVTGQQSPNWNFVPDHDQLKWTS